MGGAGARAECRSRAPHTKANTREDRKDLSTGGARDRLAEAASAAGLRGFAQTLGSRAHLLVVESEPAYEQGLREVVRYQRGVYLRGDESDHGQTVG